MDGLFLRDSRDQAVEFLGARPRPLRPLEAVDGCPLGPALHQLLDGCQFSLEVGWGRAVQLDLQAQDFLYGSSMHLQLVQRERGKVSYPASNRLVGQAYQAHWMVRHKREGLFLVGRAVHGLLRCNLSHHYSGTVDPGIASDRGKCDQEEQHDDCREGPRRKRDTSLL